MGIWINTDSISQSTDRQKYNLKKQDKVAELIEVKPNNQARRKDLGKNAQNQAAYIVNRAKWEAANKWAKGKGIRFRVITESDMFK